MSNLNELKKILVLEDEVFVALQLKSILKKLGIKEILVAHNYSKAIELVSSNEFDGILSDIDLNGEYSGIDFAKYLDKHHKHTPYLFITAQKDINTLQKVKETNSKGYVRKPFDKDDVRISLELNLSQSNQDKQESILIKSRGEEYKINLSDILFLESKNNHVLVQTINDGYLVLETLYKFRENLDNRFEQCHRSFIVNMSLVFKIDSKNIHIGPHLIPISRSYKESFKEAFKNY